MVAKWPQAKVAPRFVTSNNISCCQLTHASISDRNSEAACKANAATSVNGTASNGSISNVHNRNGCVALYSHDLCSHQVFFDNVLYARLLFRVAFSV